MKYHMQRILHDLDNGLYGDCHRAALASLLDLEYEDVPHFMQGLGPKDGGIFNLLQEHFLNERLEYTAIIFPIIHPAGPDIEYVLFVLDIWNPKTPYLLGGATKRGVGHTVIAGNGKILHDPHPSKLGISGPMDDGFYWVTYIGKKL